MILLVWLIIWEKKIISAIKKTISLSKKYVRHGRWPQRKRRESEIDPIYGQDYFDRFCVKVKTMQTSVLLNRSKIVWAVLKIKIIINVFFFLSKHICHVSLNLTAVIFLRYDQKWGSGMVGWVGGWDGRISRTFASRTPWRACRARRLAVVDGFPPFVWHVCVRFEQTRERIDYAWSLYCYGPYAMTVAYLMPKKHRVAHHADNTTLHLK